MSPDSTAQGAAVSVSPSRRDPSMENNRRLFPIFNQKMKSTTMSIYAATANKFALWMNDSKAYYPEARPHIVEILETAHSTLCFALGNADEPFTDKKMVPQFQPWWEPYMDMLRVASRFFHTFTEPELEHRLGLLFANTGIHPVTVPFAHHQKLEFGQPHTPSKKSDPVPTSTPISPTSAASSMLFHSSDTSISSRTHPSLHSDASAFFSRFPTNMKTEATTSSSVAGNNSTVAPVSAPKRKKKAMKHDFVTADLEWFKKKKESETPQPLAADANTTEPLEESASPEAKSEVGEVKADKSLLETYPTVGEPQDIGLPQRAESVTLPAETRLPPNSLANNSEVSQRPEDNPPSENTLSQKIHGGSEPVGTHLPTSAEILSSSSTKDAPNTALTRSPVFTELLLPPKDQETQKSKPCEGEAGGSPSTNLRLEHLHTFGPPRITSSPTTIKIPPLKKLKSRKSDESESMDCICEFTHEDGGLAIACDKCERWCHAVCFGITKKYVPDEWKCWECLPRQVDKECAMKIQVENLKELEKSSPKSRKKRKTRKIGVLDVYVGSPKEKQLPTRSPIKSPTRSNRSSSGSSPVKARFDPVVIPICGEVTMEDNIPEHVSPTTASPSTKGKELQASYAALDFKLLLNTEEISSAQELPGPQTIEDAASDVTTKESDTRPTGLNSAGKRPRSENGDADEAPNKRIASASKSPSIPTVPPDEPSLLPNESISRPRKQLPRVPGFEPDLITTKEMEEATQNLMTSLSLPWDDQLHRSISVSNTSDMVLDSEDESASATRPSMEGLSVSVTGPSEEDLPTEQHSQLQPDQVVVPITQITELSPSIRAVEFPAWTIKQELSEEPSEPDELMEDVDLPVDELMVEVSSPEETFPSAALSLAEKIPPALTSTPTSPQPQIQLVESQNLPLPTEVINQSATSVPDATAKALPTTTSSPPPSPPLPSSLHPFSAVESRTLLVSTSSRNPGTDILSFYMDMPLLARIAKWRNRSDDSTYPDDALCLSLACYHLNDTFSSLVNGGDGEDESQLDKSVQRSKIKCRWPNSMHAWITINDNAQPAIQLPPFSKTADGFVDVSFSARCGNNIIQLHHLNEGCGLSDYTFVVFVHSPSAAQRALAREQSQELARWNGLLEKFAELPDYPQPDWSRAGLGATTGVV